MPVPAPKPPVIAKPLKHDPIAVFVSRRTKKNLRAAGFAPLFSAAVTIERPNEPLGTHVFTAMGYLRRRHDVPLERRLAAGRRTETRARDGEEISEGRQRQKTRGRQGKSRSAAAGNAATGSGPDRDSSERDRPDFRAHGAGLVAGHLRSRSGRGNRRRHRFHRSHPLTRTPAASIRRSRVTRLRRPRPEPNSSVRPRPPGPGCVPTADRPSHKLHHGFIALIWVKNGGFVVAHRHD